MATLLFFGRLSDVANGGTVPLPDGIRDTAALKAWLGARDAPLAEALARPGTKIAVNREMRHGDVPIEDGDEIAFFSPMSGG